MAATATREEIESRVFSALEEFGAEPDLINPDATFESLDIDSLDLVELAQIVEDEYGVELTGVGAVTPLGVGARTLHERWTAGVSGIEDGFGRASEFDPKEHLSVKEVRRSDRYTQLALAAAAEALEDAGWGGDAPYDPDRAASVIGTGIGGIGTLESQHIILRDEGADRISPLSIPLLMANAAAGVVAMKHDLRGQSFGTVSACAAGA